LNFIVFMKVLWLFTSFWWKPSITSVSSI